MANDPLLESPTPSDGPPVGTLVRLGITALVIAAAVVFVLQNLENVPVEFLTFDFDAPLIVLLAIAAGVGILGRWLFHFWRARRKR